MIQRPKFTPPSDAVVVESESNFVPPNDAVVLKKKESTESTSTTQPKNSESVQTIGSLDGVGSNGFPSIDQNLGVPGLKPDLKTVDQLANPPKSKAITQQKETKKDDVDSFGEGLLNRLDTGIATISKSFYDAPKMILDAIYAPQNYLSEKLNIPSLKVDPETYAFENIPSKTMDEIISKNNKKIENYKKEIGGDVVSAFDKGDYVNTFKHAALNSMESAPLIAATMATGGESLLANSLMIGSSASTQYDQLNKEHPEMETGTKLANAAVNGALEVAVGKFMEGVGGNVWKNVLAKKGVKETTQIATNSFKKTLEKVVGNSPMVGVAGEYAEERITDGLQQLNDIATGASSDFNWDQNRNAGLSSLGFGLPNATALYSAKAYISNKTKKRVTETSKQIVKLQNDLQNPDLSPENKKIISENISKIYDENKKILGDELQKLEIMPEKTKKELVGIDKNIDKIKDSAIDIKYDVNISPENKTLLLKNLEQDFKDNINRKNEILSKTSEVEFLPLKEQDKIKRQALKELTAELNPDGKKNIEIDNAQIVERANKIYKTQQENLIKEKDAKVEIPITETEVETEVQEPTIADEEKVSTEAIPTNTEPTSVLSENQETTDVENAEPIQESVEVENSEIPINEIQAQGDNSINGNFSIGVEPMGESGIAEQQSPAKESVPSAVERRKGEIDNEVDYALNQIDKGILQWNGDINSPRIDLGISWADIRKGEADLRRGKVDSAPAKRLIEAIGKSKKEGGYRYKLGTGGANMRSIEFVTFEDLQRANNEIPLTDAELEEVNRDQEKLAKEYEDYFNSLTEEEQTETRENYENKSTVEQGVSEKPTEIGEGKNGIPNEKTPSRKEKRIKAVEASIDDLANALKDLLPSAPDTEGLKKQGLSQDDLIDFIAKNAKILASATITIDEAIRQVIDHLKSKGFDLDVDEKIVKEKIGVKKEIYKDELSDFRDLIRDIPQKDEVKNYLSGKTIERIHGETRNDQSYNAVSLADLALHGKLVMDKAKELFGEQYVEKTLEFIESANLEADERAIQYVALENEMDARVSENTNDLGERKLQDLVREKSQAHLRKSAIAINAGRLRAIMKYGIDISKYPDEILTSKQKQAKSEIEKLVQHTSEDINKEDELQEEDGFVIVEPKAKRDKAVVKSEISDVIKKLRTDLLKSAKGQSLNVSVPYAEQIAIAAPHIIKLSKLFAELGGMKTKDIIDAIHEELSKVFPAIKKSDVSSVLKEVYAEKSKPKDKKISDIVKQALIDAGFSRTVKIKGEEKTLLDWKKLAGEESSIPKLKSNVETSLKKQGYTNSQIKEISKSLEDEYIRLGADIVEKGIRELESRNKIKPTPTRKTDAKRLSELYNYGLFNGEKATEYDNLLNKTLGLSEFDIETYQKIKSLAKALASVYNKENNGRKLSEIAVQTLNSTINHQIKSLLATSALKNGTKAFNVASAFDDYVGLSMRALLGSVSTLIENKISGEFQVALQKAFSSGKITPELKKQIQADKKAVFRDITRNAGLFYGDTNTSLTHSSRFEEWLNGKADKAMAHTVVSSLMLRAFLDGVDSSVKVRLTQKAFVKNVIKLLTSETNPNGKMSTEEAIKYVSEQLTGENFEKALKTAKSIIDDVNNEQGKKVIKDTDEAIHRFAMDLVKENLLSSDMLTMDNIESAYKSAYKSAGRSIGHEANNVISAGVNLLSSTLNKRLEKAIQEKNYPLATSLTLLSTIQKSILNPFVGGGTNWVILGLEKSGNPLGYISVIHNALERKKLDLSENKTDITQSLYRESVYQDSAVRLLVGTAMAMTMFAALTAGDDDDELLGKLNQWLKDNPWAKKHFNKLSPEAVTFLLDQENNELSKHWQRVLGMKNDYFDNTKTLINTFSDENSSMSGAFGAFLGQNLSSPGPWKTIKDVRDILRGLKGRPEIKTDYKTNGFWNGYFRGGLIDFMKLRPEVNYDLNSKIDKVKDDAKKLNSEIDSFVKEIYDKKLSDSEINKKINELFDKEPLKKEKILTAVKNRAEEEKLKRSGVDPFYIKLKRESNDEIKAILFQDRFKDVSKLSQQERDEIVKGMNAIKFTGGKEFWNAYWRLSKPEMFKNKPVN